MGSASRDWSRIAELVDEGLALVPAARATWLEKLARSDPAIASTVRRLMEARVAETDTIGSVPRPGALLAHRSGERVGPYVLLELLGSGGMGEVWLARRDDGALKRDVALKLPLRDPRRRDVALRFARERDILASLEHPSIARLYDAGVANGQPYLAMERVQGQHITGYADAVGLDVDGRLELFLQVLAAVQYAHANLVLHRDLKPSNVLVTDDGQARLLDFGVATLLEPEGPAADSALTRASGRPLTPGYASPEQILGNPLSTASDVYSAGVVLFELLTGSRPYQLDGGSPAELASAILATQPSRPSDSVNEMLAPARGSTPAKLRRRLAGDLDDILLRALAKQPAARYPSATAFADDIRRSLERVPLEARSTSRVYRVERFVSRHRWMVLASVAVACALVASTTFAIAQTRQARAEKRMAQAEARNARAVRDFLIEVLSAADPATPGKKPPRDTTVQEAVDAAAASIGSALSDAPREKVSVLTTLAGIYSSLDMPDRSMELFQQALAVAEKERIPNQEQAEVLVRLANAAMFAGRFDESRSWLERAERVFTALGDETSESFAQSLKIRGNLVRRGNNPDLKAGVALLERATALFRERYPESDGRLGALFFLAQTLRASNIPVRAETVADEAVAVVAGRSAAGYERPNAYSLRAVIRDSNGKLAEANADFIQAHQGYLQTTGPSHFLTVQNQGLQGMTLLEMGGHRDEALASVRASAEALIRVRPGSPTHAQSVERLGVALLRVGRPEQAIPVLEEARALWAKRGEAVYRVAPTLSLAEARAALGDVAGSRALLDEALSVIQSSPRTALQPEGDVHLVRGLIAADRAETAEAHTALAQALALSGWESRSDLSRRLLADAGRTRLALSSGQVPEALAASDRVLELARNPALAQLPRLRATALEARGTSLCSAGRAEEGEPMLAEAVPLLTAVMDRESVPVARLQLARAGCLLERGRKAEAAAQVDEARRTLQAAGPAGGVLQANLRGLQERLTASR